MRSIIAFFFVAALFAIAQPADPDYGPAAISIEHASAVLVVSSVDATSATASWRVKGNATWTVSNSAMWKAASTVPPLWRKFVHNPAGSALLNILPGTTYQYQITLKKTAEPDWVSPILEFTTKAADSAFDEPAPPEEILGAGGVPDQDKVLAMPPGPYKEYAVTQADCSDLPGILSGLASYDPRTDPGHYYNVRVTIPTEIGGMPVRCGGINTADGIYSGYYRLYARPNHISGAEDNETDKGWVIIRSDQEGTDAFAPEGVRAGPRWKGKYAHFVNNLRYGAAQSSMAGLTDACYTTQNLPDTVAHILLLPITSPTQLFPYLYCGGTFQGKLPSTEFPAYSGCTTITAMVSTSPVVATVDCTDTTGLQNAVTAGMVVTIPTNGYTAPGTYFVTEVSGNTIKLNLATHIANGTLSGNTTFSVLNAWRMPVYKGTTTAAFDTTTKIPQYIVTSGVPAGPCPENMFALDTSRSPAVAYWCVDPTGTDDTSTVGIWRPMFQTGGSDSLFLVDPTAKKYRLVGIEMELAATPLPAPDGWHFISGRQQQGQYRTTFRVSGDNIVLDRVWVHPTLDDACDLSTDAGAKHCLPGIRVGRTLSWAATNGAVINSWFGPAQTWTTAATDYTGSNGVVWEPGSHHVLFENNYMSSSTINFYDDPSSRDVGNQHLTFRRNYLTRQEYLRRGSAAYAKVLGGTSIDNSFFTTRNQFEFKQGHHASITGNRFDLIWQSWANGSNICLTSYGASYSSSTGWWNTGISSVGGSPGDGVLNLAAAGPWKVHEWVMITGMDEPTWNGFHEITATSCTSTYAPCSQITVSGTSGTPSSFAGAVVWPIVTDRGNYDIAIKHNLFSRYHAPWTLISLATNTEKQNGVMTTISRRIAATDNLWQDMRAGDYNVDDTAAYDEPASNQHSLGMVFDPQGAAFEYMQFSRNTVVNDWSSSSSNTIWGPAADRGTTYGVKARDNIIHFAPNQTVPTTILTDMTSKWVGPSDFTHNVICCNLAFGRSANDVGGTYKWPVAESDMGWFKVSAPTIPSDLNPINWKAKGDFRLRYNSRFISGATPGSDPITGADPGMRRLGMGVNVDLLNAELGTVSNIRARQIQATQATISYLAPDSGACTVEVSTSATWGTGARFGDGGGSRVRNVDATGLSAGQKYYARVLCAVEQPEITFTTLP